MTSRTTLEKFLEHYLSSASEEEIENDSARVLERLRAQKKQILPEPPRSHLRSLQTASRRRRGRVIVLVAAAATAVILAQQLATRTSSPTQREDPNASLQAQRAVAATAQVAREDSSAPANATRVSTTFAAVSIRTNPPNTTISGAGLACHGIDGVQRLVLALTPKLQDSVTAPLGRCLGTGVFLSTLIEMAYEVSPEQIFGGPEWSRLSGYGYATVHISGGRPQRGAILSMAARANEDSFAWLENESLQIQAIADNPSQAKLADLRQMLRAALADRFNLRVHTEKRNVPGYSLVVAEGAHKLNPIVGDYLESLAFQQGRSTLDKFARNLARFLFDEVPIVDKTGLIGPFEYQFEPIHFSNDNSPGAVEGGGRGRGDGQPAATTRVESLSKALEEQLGLRLQPEKTISVNAVIIDSVETLSPN